MPLNRQCLKFFVGVWILKIKELFSNKKFKNIFITVIEILVVAGIIYGAMMLVLEKINYDADKIGITSEKKEEEKGTGNYTVQVNLAKNAVIIYEINKDKSKDAIKVFPASIGKDLDKGKYTAKEKYSWVREDNDWHQYSVKFDNVAYIQSASYTDKYPYTLKNKSYNNIGKKVDGNDILLYAKDAQWIYKNCKKGVKINIVKGKKSDELPLEFESKINLTKYSGWDPTDPNKNNPFKKVKNGEIAVGSETVYIEKGSKVDYLANVLMLDADGKDATNSLKYKKIKTDSLGKSKITYTFTGSDGKTEKVTQKVRIVDTTPPVVSCSKNQFTYQVDGRSKEDMNSDDNVKAIEKMVRQYVSVNESGCTITVRTVGKTELMEGNFPVSIKAQDEAGNVGSYGVMCEITVKKVKPSNKNTPSEKIEQIKKEREEQEETTKKKKSSKKNKDKDDEKETKTDETTEVIEDNGEKSEE